MNTRGGRRSPSLSPPAISSTPIMTKQQRKVDGRRRKGPKAASVRNGASEPANGIPAAVAATSDDSESGQSSTSKVSSTVSRKRGHAPSTGSSGSDITMSPSKKARGNANAAPADTEMERKWFSTIKSVLTKHYFDVVGRLRLDFQPGCLNNLDYCAQYHGRNGVRLGK